MNKAIENKIEALIESALIQEEFAQGIEARKAAGKRLTERRKASDKKYTGVERRKSVTQATNPNAAPMKFN